MLHTLPDDLAAAGGVTRKTLAAFEAGQTRPHPVHFIQTDVGVGVLLSWDSTA